LSTSSTTDGGIPSLLEVGRVARPHGLSGEVVVAAISNRPERFARGAVLHLSGPGAGTLTVAEARPHQGRLIVQFEGVAGREAAEQLRGAVLLAEPVEDPDAFFVHELIGVEVVEVGGVSRGRVAAVQANPASDLLVGEAGWLVPLRFVVERRDDRLVVDGPPGLFE
jgi:16S rRNA processing protein RimM